jgi:hypothetical protein
MPLTQKIQSSWRDSRSHALTPVLNTPSQMELDPRGRDHQENTESGFMATISTRVGTGKSELSLVMSGEELALQEWLGTPVAVDDCGSDGPCYSVQAKLCGASHPGGALLDDAAVRAALRRLSALSVSLCKSILYGAFVWARRALSRQKRRFPARAGSCR